MITAQTIGLDVQKSHQKKIRKMLRNRERLSDGTIRERNITNHIDLVQGARPFKSDPYQAGLKKCELEQFEIDKPLRDGVIEP